MDLTKVNNMYIEFTIAKGVKTLRTTSGKIITVNRAPRIICAPYKELKAEQRRILYEELVSIPMNECAYGFINGKNIVDNAKIHLAKHDIMNMDMKDFFDTITCDQVYRALRNEGMAEEKAEYISKVCTRNGRLPQGAPTSPALSNIVMKPVDTYIMRVCKEKGLNYTRYADDLTISGDAGCYETLQQLKKDIQSLLNKKGLKLNRAKTELMGTHVPQFVTGIQVNRVVGSSVKIEKRMRAWLHNIERDIKAGKLKSYEDIEHSYVPFSSIYGYVSFMCQTNRKYECYLDQANRIRGLLKKKVV